MRDFLDRAMAWMQRRMEARRAANVCRTCGWLRAHHDADGLIYTVHVLCDGFRPSPPPRPTVSRFGPFFSPHPHRHAVLHVEASSPAEAWAVIRGAA